MDGMLLQSVEGIGESPFAGSGGEVWESLQAEKEAVSRDLLGEPVFADDREPSMEVDREIECRHREDMEERLRAINDAQDRLMDGGYGLCAECGAHIGGKRLLADPAAALCLVCQQMTEEAAARDLFVRR